MTTLITGASSGLGEEMARQLAEAGHDLALCARSLDRLEDLRDEILGKHPHLRVEVAELDVCDEGAVERVFREFEDLAGPINRVIVNAGVGSGARIGTGQAHINRQTLKINTIGALNQMESAMSLFRERRRGHLVLISSFAAVRGMRGSMASYGASKAAVAYLGEGLRLERVPGVDITVISPGYIATPMTGGGNKPLMAQAPAAVQEMVKVIEQRKARAFIPRWPWAILAPVMARLPASIFRKLT